MNAIEKLKAKIASGEITSGRKTSVSVGEGTFKCVIASTEYADNQAGTAKRGMVKYKVVANMVNTQDVKPVGGLFNTYIGTTNEVFLEQNIATYLEIAKIAGISEDKIYDDVETLPEVLENILNLLSKQVGRGKEIVVHIRRKEQDKKSAQGKPQYWTDILESTWKGEDDSAPVEDKETESETKSEAKAEEKKPWE